MLFLLECDVGALVAFTSQLNYLWNGAVGLISSTQTGLFYVGNARRKPGKIVFSIFYAVQTFL